MCAHARLAACTSLSDTVSAVQALEELRKQPSGWWGVVLSPLITQIREYHTIHNLSTFPVSHAFCHLAISCQLCMHVCHLQYSQEHLHRLVANVHSLLLLLLLLSNLLLSQRASFSQMSTDHLGKSPL